MLFLPIFIKVSSVLPLMKQHLKQFNGIGKIAPNYNKHKRCGTWSHFVGCVLSINHVWLHF